MRLKVLSGVAVLALVLSGCDWAQVGFGPDHRSYNPYEPAITEASVANLEAAWSTPCSCGRVLVVGGTVYLADGTTLRAFNAATGEPRWSTPIGSDFTLNAVLNGLVYLTLRPASGSHQLVARDASDGALRFVFTPPTATSQPVSIGDVIVDGPLAFVAATTDSTTVYAINPAGGIVWAKTPGGFTTHLVADPGRTVYIGTSIPITSGPEFVVPLLTGYRQSDGAVMSSAFVRVPSGGADARAFANGLVYVFSEFGRASRGVGMSAIDPASGQVKWGDPSEPLAVAPNAVLSSSEVHWIASNPVTGEQLWERLDLPPFINAGLAVSGLFLRGTGGELVAHRLSDGSIAGSFTPGGTVLDVVTAGGQIYVTTDTQLVAIKPAS